MNIGRKVRQAREGRGLTQVDLALRAATTQAAISRLERDSISSSLASLERVFLALGMRLTVTVVPIDSWTDDAELRDAAKRTPSQRIDFAVAGMNGLADILGAARGE